MWIVRDKEKVVGTASFTPKRLKIGSQMPGAAEIGDTYTHPAYQRRGIFSTLVQSVKQDALDNHDIEFIYGTPNQESLPGYETKLNFPRIPGLQVVNMVRPLKIERVALGRFGSVWRAKVVAMGMRFVYAAWYRPRKPFSAIQVAEVESFPPEINLLWSAVADAYDVIMVRDSTYLEWRFGGNPDEYAIVIMYDSQQVIGYVITKPGLWKGLKVLYIADYLTLPERKAAFDVALFAILKHAQSQEMDMISCWSVGTSEYAQVLKEHGFLRFRDVPIICYANELGTRVINTDYKWHFTMADSDNI
jgi:GNAT superfamily N-acetyltransferase